MCLHQDLEFNSIFAINFYAMQNQPSVMSLANGLTASNITGCKGALFHIQIADDYSRYTGET